MASIFVSRTPAVKTKEQRKVSALAKRINTAKRKASLSGPCTVVYQMSPKAE